MRGKYKNAQLNFGAMLLRYTKRIDDMDTVELQSVVIAKLESKTRLATSSISRSRAGVSLVAKLAASRMLSSVQVNHNLLKVLTIKPSKASNILVERNANVRKVHSGVLQTKMSQMDIRDSTMIVKKKK